MIFDTPEMLALTAKYENKQPYEIPFVVKIGNETRYYGEKKYLENLFAALPLKNRSRWLRRFISDNRTQFWGAWFELMLYGWLRSLGDVQYESDDQQPDFILTIDPRSKIMVEAKAVLTPQTEWLEDNFFSQIVLALREIQKPYAVRVANFIMSDKNTFERSKFKKDIDIWLSNNPDKEYFWKDRFGNEINLIAHYEPSQGHAYGVRWSDIKRDIGVLKNALGKKAKQHRKLREEGFPYVIGVLLQSYSFRPRDVVDAWLGNPVVQVDRQSGKLTLTTDESGLHYSRRQIVHTSLSGTLVFVKNYNEASTMNELNAYWIENPFADERIRLSNETFPAVDRYIVMENRGEKILMKWMSEIG